MNTTLLVAVIGFGAGFYYLTKAAFQITFHFSVIVLRFVFACLFPPVMSWLGVGYMRINARIKQYQQLKRRTS